MARPTPAQGLLPVVGADEQVEVAGVHIIEDVLAVCVYHLHVVVHLLLWGQRERFITTEATAVGRKSMAGAETTVIEVHGMSVVPSADD